MDLSIIIVNYKTKGLLKQCLRGIYASRLECSFEVIVIDSASGDGSIDMVRHDFPEVVVIPLEVNRGLAVGNNAGLKIAKGRFLLVMNPDVAIFSGGVEIIMKYLTEHPQVGLAVPKLINPDGSYQLSAMRFPRFMIAVWRRTPFGKLPVPAAMVERFLMKDWDHKETRPIGWGLGACFMFSRKTMEIVGLFDERFFLYLEDVDYCRRVWQAGLEVHYVTSAEFVHYHERLSAKQPFWMGLFSYPARIHMRSWIKYFSKYLGAPPPPKELCV